MTRGSPPSQRRRKLPPDPSLPEEVNNPVPLDSSPKPSTKKARRPLPLPTNPKQPPVDIPNEGTPPIVTGEPDPLNLDDPTVRDGVDITFHGEFEHFQLQSDQRKKLQKELENSLARYKKGKGFLQPDDSIHSIEKTLQRLESNNDIILVYLRLARQVRPNFHTDSICSLLCIAKQCNVTPYNFLKKIIGLEVRNNSNFNIGLSFSFITYPTKDHQSATIDAKFIELKHILNVLQATATKPVASSGSNTQQKLGKHTGDLALKKILSGIHHRWLAFHIIEHVFAPWYWTSQQIFKFSIDMFASTSGKVPFEVLTALVGLCFRYNDVQDLKQDKDRFSGMVSKPSDFYSYGETCLRDASQRVQVDLMFTTFTSLQKVMKRHTTYKALSPVNKWLLLKAYTFHLWIDFPKNEAIKTSVWQRIAHPTLKDPPPASQAQTPAKDPPLDHPKNPFDSDENSVYQDTPPPPTPKELEMMEDSSVTKPSEAALDGLQLLMNSTTFPSLPLRNDAEQSVPDVMPDTNSLTLVHITSDPRCDWEKLRLLSTDELNQLVTSFLIIRNQDDGMDIVSRLSSFEVYSADNLHKWNHCRLNGKQNFFPSNHIGEVSLTIGSRRQEFIDPNKWLHIARQNSSLCTAYGTLIPPVRDIAALCRSIIIHGYSDAKRCPQQCRAFIGNGGLNFPDGIPSTIVDGGFRKKLSGDPNFSCPSILKTIGRLTQYTWKVLVQMQSLAKDCPLAPDKARHSAYALHLCNTLFMDPDVAFENVVIAVCPIFPTTCDLMEHVDTMNDSVVGYTRTGTLSMCFLIENNDFKIGLQLMVIGSFRKVVRHYTASFSSIIPTIRKTVDSYVERYYKQVHSLFAGRSDVEPNVFSRKWLYLDDTMPLIKRKYGSSSFSVECINLPTGISKIMSLSTVIFQIRQTQQYLQYDQWMELAFAFALLDNQYIFDIVMDELTRKNDNIQFQLHPFFDVLIKAHSIFGDLGTTLLQSFGHHKNSTNQTRETGKRRLEGVMEILYHHGNWVDSKWRQQVETPGQDLPIQDIERHMTDVAKRVQVVAQCPFDMSMLLVFHKVMLGCGGFRPGQHLSFMSFPFTGTDLYKHLASIEINYDKSLSTSELNNIDRLMAYVSASCGRPRYSREEMDSLLSISFHTINKVLPCDWFRRDRPIYDCLEDGVIIQRDYGKSSSWNKLTDDNRLRDLAYIKLVIRYIEFEEVLAYKAIILGGRLRENGSTDKVVFEGRTTIAANATQQYINKLQPTTANWKRYSYKAATFYEREYANSKQVVSLNVLSDCTSPKVLSEVNAFDDYEEAKELLQYLHAQFGRSPYLNVMRSACYHQQVAKDENTKWTVFEGHVDKGFVHTAWFVPLSACSFFTFVAVPSDWCIQPDVESITQLENWTISLTQIEKDKIQSFKNEFLRQAQSFMKTEAISVLVYYCAAGTFLSFPANICYHATISVEGVDPKDLMIFYPMVGPSN